MAGGDRGLGAERGRRAPEAHSQEGLRGLGQAGRRDGSQVDLSPPGKELPFFALAWGP